MISAKARCKRDTQRFWNRIKKRDATSGCELFVSKKGTRLKRGSRVFKHKGKLWIVSRLAWTLRHGEIPEGLNICHTCDTPDCTRDDHHFLGTQADNVADAVAKGRVRGATGNANASRKYPERRPRGSQVWRAATTEKEVKQILKRLAKGARQADVARQFGLKKQVIFSIKHRQTWRHVKP